MRFRSPASGCGSTSSGRACRPSTARRASASTSIRSASTACSTGSTRSASRWAMRTRSAPSRRGAKRSSPGTSDMTIAVLHGDGIGPEIISQALRVLKKLDLRMEFQETPVGGAAYAAHGDPLPEQTLSLAKRADAVLFGAVGDPKYDSLPRAKRPEQAILGLRKGLGLFANLRPARVHPELAAASSLRSEVVAGLDILIVRELTGDIYFGQPKGIQEKDGVREGFDTMRYSEPEVRRIARVGFEAARKRGRKLCSVDKANVLETSQLWREV